jgi:hypothetical protein
MCINSPIVKLPIVRIIKEGILWLSRAKIRTFKIMLLVDNMQALLIFNLLLKDRA